MQRTWLPSLLACSFIAAYFAVWFAQGVFGGRIWFVEDTAAYFFSNGMQLHALAHDGAWSFWDPLRGLGQPRLADLVSGLLSPFSLLFYWLPTAQVISFYPALTLTLLAVFCFGLFRAKGLGVAPSLFGALSWASLGNVVAHTQQPPGIEPLVWLPATLLCWELHRQRRKPLWAIAAGVAFAFLCLGAPQFVLYNALVLLVWIGLDLIDDRRDDFVRLACAAAGVALLGICLASWQLLPAAEFAADGHRNLVSGSGFAGMARAAPHEVLLALAEESFLLFEKPPVLRYGAPYPNLPNLSIVTTGFALFALAGGARRRIEGLVASFFLIGMLGADGGVTTVLGWIFPFADRLRAPIRMIVPAGFLISWLAACGMDRFYRSGGRARGVAVALAIVWLGVLGYGLQWHDDRYVDPSAFEVPAVVANAEPRMAVDIRSSDRDLPLFAINSGLAAGVPSLLTREPLRPRNLFEAIAASQHHPFRSPRRLDLLIAATVLGLPRPELPILRSFGLATIVRYRGGQYESVEVPGAMPRFFLVRDLIVASERDERWRLAADANWDPREQAIVAEAISLPEVDSEALPDRVEVLADDRDHQAVNVRSAGGLLVTSGLFYPGWTVTVDGVAADPIEVNLALRGVVVPPGSHAVEWAYRPTWLPVAIAATAFAAVLVVAMGLGLRRTLF